MNRVVARFSDEEFVRAAANAASENPPKALAFWVVEAAVAPKNPRRSRPQRVRADLLVVLMDLRRQLAGAATNANQMAKVANSTGVINPAAAHVVASIEAIAREISEAIRVLAEDQ